jgi:hypothetical protein
MIRLELTIEEVNGILAALGELPTKTNAMFLIQKIQSQAQPQVPPEKHHRTHDRCFSKSSGT